MTLILLLTLLLLSPITVDSLSSDTTSLAQDSASLELLAQTEAQDSITDEAIAEEIFEEEVAMAEEQALAEREDSALIAVEADLKVPYSTTVFDDELINWTLSWLDTTLCDFTPDTMALPDSVYIRRLQAMPRVMEMTYNSYVRAQIERYTIRNPRHLAALRRLTDYYFPIFEDALSRHGIPDELKYLAVIESALNATAHSRVGAAGLWQFMPSTGKLLGLEVNSLVDERYDTHKATDAACRYLKSLYSIYHDWTLVIAAYNCGPGNVNKAIHRSGGKHDFYSIFPYLPRETRSYVPIFVAANYSLYYADEHGICKGDIDLFSQPTDTITTDRRLHFKQVADVLNIPITSLRRLNPQYTKDILPGGKPYSLILPSQATAGFIQLSDSIFAYKADSLINNRKATIDLAQKTAIDGSYRSGNTTYYKIKKGDTLGGIAKRYHCTVKQLQKWNNLKSTNIQIGKTLKIRK